MDASDHHDDAKVRVGRRFSFHGVVQGVGFRPWMQRLATSLGITGSVRNDARGVTVDAFGTSAELDDLERRARSEAPPAASVESVVVQVIATEPRATFAIVETRDDPLASAEGLRVSIPPDLATCPACLAEITDPADRRYRYAFTNCTHCGPRFTIARDVPYDRARTTMAAFRMCPACAEEYRTPSNRRFHAQPNACPRCGPRLELRGADGARLDALDPLADAGAALRAGLVVAVKGLGGFHLACDATSSEAVSVLRARKRREEKPLAVMVADLAAAERLAELSEEERRLLAGAPRPIVIVRRRPDARLAPEVAMGAPSVGIMLAYTPLHHLLLAEAARPLVMTSGNLSDEPIVIDNAQALLQLASIADRFLLHDRSIDARADDSVARVVAGRPLLLRRSRGWVPRGVTAPRSVARPVLAVGAHLKNTFALARGDTVILGPHVGDLETVEAYAALEAMVARMERFLSLRPSVIACDLHPGYLSTRYARARAADMDVPLVPVQHHHAHVVGAMVDNGLADPAFGLAWDGTGLGADGSSWGGELMLATYGEYERLATFRALPLPGGERAIRECWRTALALVDDAFSGEAPLDRLPVLAARSPREVAVVRQLVAGAVNAPPSHGVGRLFDAVGALVLGRGEARFEAQLAMELEWAADPSEREPYPFALHVAVSPWEADLRPAVRALVADLERGVPSARIAGRFHETLAAVAEAILGEAMRRHGRHPVVLTGGCFQNARLVEACLRRLSVAGFDVRMHRQFPPGDGGLAVGQALAADAILRARGGS